MKKTRLLISIILVVVLFFLVALTVGAADKIYAGETINFLVVQPHVVGGNNLAKMFEEETGCKVVVSAVPLPNCIEKPVLDVTSGVGYFDNIEYWYPGLGTMVENEVLVDVTEWWNSKAVELDFDDYMEDFANMYTLLDGKRYGVPFDGDLWILWYNKTIFAKHNLNPPATWDEYLECAKTITEAEKGNNVYGAGIMGFKDPFVLVGSFLSRLGSYGGSFFDSNNKPIVNSPEAVAALEGLIEQGKYAYSKPTAVHFDELMSGWTSGKIAMVEFWTDMGAMSDNPEESAIVGQWGAVPIPKGPGPKGQVIAPANAGFGIGVSTLSKNKEIAMAFMEFAARPDVCLEYNTIVGGIDPVRWSTLNSQKYIDFVGPEVAEAIKTAHEHSVFWPRNAEWFDLQESLTDNLSLALSGDKSPQQALDDTQKVWEEILSK